MRLFRAVGHRLPGRTKQDNLSDCFCFGATVVLNRRTHADRGRLLIDTRRRHKRAPVSHVDGLTKGHRHFAVNPRARIPAGAVVACINVYRNDIGAAEFHVGRGIDAKRHVAVVPLAGQLSVYVDLGKRHDAIEVKVHAPTTIRLVERERLSIPALSSPRKLAGVAVLRRVEWSRDGPIVRQTDGLPSRVVEVRLLRSCLVAFGKLPAGVEAHRAPAPGCVGRPCLRCQDRHRSHSNRHDGNSPWVHCVLLIRPRLPHENHCCVTIQSDKNSRKGQGCNARRTKKEGQMALPTGSPGHDGNRRNFVKDRSVERHRVMSY